MTFGEVIREMKKHDASRYARTGWNGRGMWVALQVPDGASKMSQPYIYFSTVTGSLVPWVASHSDMLAEDWARIT